MNVNVAAHGVAIITSIKAGLQPLEPEYAGKDPVPLGEMGCKGRAVDLAGRSPSDEHGTQRPTNANFAVNSVTAAWRTAAAVALARPVCCSRHRIAGHRLAVDMQPQTLPGQADV